MCVCCVQLLPADSAIEAQHRHLMSAAAEYQRRTFIVSTKDKDKEETPRDEQPALTVSRSAPASFISYCGEGDWIGLVETPLSSCLYTQL